jgi:hypothetical protein
MIINESILPLFKEKQDLKKKGTKRASGFDVSTIDPTCTQNIDLSNKSGDAIIESCFKFLKLSDVR